MRREVGGRWVMVALVVLLLASPAWAGGQPAWMVAGEPAATAWLESGLAWWERLMDWTRGLLDVQPQATCDVGISIDPNGCPNGVSQSIPGNPVDPDH